MASRSATLPGHSSRENFRPYDFLSRQPSIRISVELPLGALRDVSCIDRWLLGPFAVLPERLARDTSQPPDDTRDALAAAVAQRALVLFGELCRAAGIPSFESGRVLAMRPIAHSPQDREAVLLLPVIDHVPVSAFGKILKDIVRLLVTNLASEPEPSLVERVLADLKGNLVDRLASALNFNSSTLPICRLAFKQDIPFRHVGNGFFLFCTGARSVITRGSAVGRDSALGAQICSYKQITAEILRAAGLPAADHVVVDSHQAALAAARELGWPVVVKPSNLERSQGVTTNITSEAALIAAYDLASAAGGQTLVERQIAGICHRIMIADGQMVYTVIRYAKGVIGNGRDTVAELAASANAEAARLPPWKRLKDVPLDAAAIACLAEQGLTPQSVPAAGRRAFVRPITSGEWGGDVENLTARVHPDNVALAISAASVLGLSIAGVDLMSVDIARPWHENGAAIIEVNFDPQFATSYREDVAAQLLPAFVAGDGRITVHLVTGQGDLLGQARALRLRLSADNRAIHITGAGHTEDHLGGEIAMAAGTLFERGLALAMRPDVHELILIGSEAELFAQGLPVDRLASAHVVHDDPQRRQQVESELRARFRIGDRS
jgi:cyanophycin synthetase